MGDLDPGAGGDQGGGQGGGGAVASPDWAGMVSGLPEDLRGHATFGTTKSFEDFARQHVNLERKLGERGYAKADASWGDKEWGAAYDALGHPKDGKAYKFEGLDLGEGRTTSEMLDRFRPLFAKARLSESQARAVVDGYLSYAKELTDAHAKSVADLQPKLMEKHYATYGGKEGLEKAQVVAQQGAEALFGESLEVFRLATMPDGTHVLDHPLMFEMLVEAGKSLQEGDLPAGGGSGAGGPASALASFMADAENVKALNDPQHPRHKEVVEERQRLQQAASAGRESSPFAGLFRPIGL